MLEKVHPVWLLKVESHVLTILSDKTKEDVSFLKKNYSRYLIVVDSGLLNITFHVYLPLLCRSEYLQIVLLRALEGRLDSI